MSLTVKYLIDCLKMYSENANVINHEAQDFVHISSLTNGDVILSTERPIGYCKRSGGYVFVTNVEDYLGVVPELDENVDLCEIELPNLKEEVNPTKFGEAIERESKYKKAFYMLLNEVDIPQSVLEKLSKMDIDFS